MIGKIKYVLKISGTKKCLEWRLISVEGRELLSWETPSHLWFIPDDGSFIMRSFPDENGQKIVMSSEYQCAQYVNILDDMEEFGMDKSLLDEADSHYKIYLASRLNKIGCRLEINGVSVSTIASNKSNQ